LPEVTFKKNIHLAIVVSRDGTEYLEVFFLTKANQRDKRKYQVDRQESYHLYRFVFVTVFATIGVDEASPYSASHPANFIRTNLMYAGWIHNGLRYRRN